MTLPFLNQNSKPQINLPEGYKDWPESAQRHYMEAQAAAVKAVADADARTTIVKSRHKTILYSIIGSIFAASVALSTFGSINDNNPPSLSDDSTNTPPPVAPKNMVLKLDELNQG